MYKYANISCPPTHIYTYTHIYAHTYVYTYIHTYIRIYIYMHIHIRMHTYTHAYAWAGVNSLTEYDGVCWNMTVDDDSLLSILTRMPIHNSALLHPLTNWHTCPKQILRF